MKLLNQIKNRTNVFAKALACFAMTSVVVAGIPCCIFIFHQPEMPDELAQRIRAKYE